MNLTWIRILFLLSAIYDFILGAAFIIGGAQPFEWFDVPVPKHMGFVQFCCLMLMIFGLMFLTVAINPRANRNLIPFGILLKAAYIGVTGYYWVFGGIPFIFKPFMLVDGIMLLLFAWAFVSLGSKTKSAVRL